MKPLKDETPQPTTQPETQPDEVIETPAEVVPDEKVITGKKTSGAVVIVLIILLVATVAYFVYTNLQKETAEK